MRKNKTRTEHAPEIVRVSATSPTRLSPSERRTLVSTIRLVLRQKVWVALQINAVATIVRGGDLDAIVGMLERREIGVGVSS